MRTRWTLLAAPLVAMSACSDSTGPKEQQFVDLLLNFCSAFGAPIFFAHQNQGEEWTAVNPDGSGTVGFTASGRVALAYTTQSTSDDLTIFRTSVIYTTAEELTPLSGIACAQTSGTKVLNGTVASVPEGSGTWISMARSNATAGGSQDASFQLTNLPSGPRDLVAQREQFTLNDVVPNRVIVRRAQDFVSGATIPELDFGSSSASSAFVSNTATLSGIGLSEGGVFALDFLTPLGTEHSIYFGNSVANGTRPIYSIPTTLVQTGDIHRLEMFLQGNAPAFRGIQLFYRNAGDRTVTPGPALSAPTISTASSTPYLRPRAQLTVQGDYGSLAVAVFAQEIGTTERIFRILASPGYFSSAPSTWNLEMPDLSGVAGFPLEGRLQSGAFTDWLVQAQSGSITVFLGGAPEDGSTNRYAARFSGAAVQLSRTPGARGERRPEFPGEATIMRR